MQHGISYEQHLAEVASRHQTWASCDICEERVRIEDLVEFDAGTCCPECSLLSDEEQTAIVQRSIERHVARMRSRGQVSLFEAIAPRRADFGGGV